MRDLAAVVGSTPLIVCSKALETLGYGPHSVNMAVTASMAREVERHFAAHPQQPTAQQGGESTLLQQYDRERLPGYRAGYEDGRQRGYIVGKRHAEEAAAAHAQQPAALTDAQGPGLMVNARPDGVWLAFSSSSTGRRALLNIERIAESHGSIVRRALRDWAGDVLAAAATQATTTDTKGA